MHPHETLWHGDCVALGVGMTSQVAARLRLSKEIVAEPSARVLSRWAMASTPGGEMTVRGPPVQLVHAPLPTQATY